MGQSSFKPSHAKNTGRKFNPRKDIDAMYDKDWERYRGKYLAINPECYACGSKSTVVDHLKPHKGDAKLFEQLDNHIPLCVACHNTVTTKFDRNYKIGSPITPKIEWLNRNRVPGAGWNPRRVKVMARYRE